MATMPRKFRKRKGIGVGEMSVDYGQLQATLERLEGPQAKPWKIEFCPVCALNFQAPRDTNQLADAPRRNSITRLDRRPWIVGGKVARRRPGTPLCPDKNQLSLRSNGNTVSDDMCKPIRIVRFFVLFLMINVNTTTVPASLVPHLFLTEIQLRSALSR